MTDHSPSTIVAGRVESQFRELWKRLEKEFNRALRACPDRADQIEAVRDTATHIKDCLRRIHLWRNRCGESGGNDDWRVDAAAQLRQINAALFRHSEQYETLLNDRTLSAFFDSDDQAEIKLGPPTNCTTWIGHLREFAWWHCCILAGRPIADYDLRIRPDQVNEINRRFDEWPDFNYGGKAVALAAPVTSIAELADAVIAELRKPVATTTSFTLPPGDSGPHLVRHYAGTLPIVAGSALHNAMDALIAALPDEMTFVDETGHRMLADQFHPWHLLCDVSRSPIQSRNAYLDAIDRMQRQRELLIEWLSDLTKPIGPPAKRHGDVTGSTDLAAEDSTKRRTVNAVIADAEKHLERNPWPGHNAFAKLLNCSRATLTKACNKSAVLFKAKTEHETRSKSVSAKSGRGMELVEDASSEPCDEDLDEVLDRALKLCTSDEERETLRTMPKDQLAEMAGIAFTDADTGKSRRTLNRQ